MTSRLWHGWTTPENADGYEALIRSTIFPGILGRGVAGLERVELHRRPLGAEVELVTVMRFAFWDAVRAFADPDRGVSVVLPPAARAVLARFDGAARHYEVRVEGPPARRPDEPRSRKRREGSRRAARLGRSPAAIRRSWP